MAQVILLTGVSGSGKDAIAEHLYKHFMNQGIPTEILHNADPVKRAIKQHLGIDDYKTDKGKKIIMGVTNIMYEVDPYYFEEQMLEKMEGETQVLIIPDWRYKNTFDFWSLSSSMKVYTIMIQRDMRCVPGYASEVKLKENNLLKELHPEYCVFNKEGDVMYAVNEIINGILN